MKNLDQLKTFSDASKLLKLDPKKVIPDFKNFPTRDRKAMVAHAKLVVIARAANKIGNGGKEWKPDWSNPKQYTHGFIWTAVRPVFGSTTAIIGTRFRLSALAFALSLPMLVST